MIDILGGCQDLMQSIVVCVLQGLEMVEEAFLKEVVWPNLCRERRSGTYSRFEERHKQMSGL